MLKKAARFVVDWFRGEGQEGIVTSPSETALFVLQYEELTIGTLRLHDGVWEFKYAPEFQSQLGRDDGVQPLVDFPDAQRVYESSELWPFFMARIPSVSQPRVLEEIERLGLDQTSASQLLRAFGQRSIANPFVLKPA